ncbi:hypothetical protein EYF80_066237 [Liparis tanakae]|uniref:Uncharacterized protein n=1 Tax=Liparis tanakae TaxID=230148 RepID=A0A4Z2E4H7_9TELE|nr:hypothetical protein EYF80_066237 [Liparis tanakae]
MSHKRWSSATHRVQTGIINEFLIKGATALTLQVGVLTRPFLASGSCTKRATASRLSPKIAAETSDAINLRPGDRRAVSAAGSCQILKYSTGGPINYAGDELLIG